MEHTKPNADEITEAPMLTRQDVNTLLLAEEAPCVTVYIPTSPVSNYQEQNRIYYKDQIKKVGNALDERDMDKYLRAELIDQLQSVGVTDWFWAHQQYGLAVFVSSERFMVRRMMISPASLGIVADSFHLRPALREIRNWMRYQVLCIDLHEVALYDCNQDNIAEAELHEDVPRSIVDAIGHTETAVNRKDLNSVGNESTDLQRYFQAVDQAIHNHHNGQTDLPLLLAMVSEHQGLFREASRNPNLMESGLNREPFHEIAQRRLGRVTWEVAEDELAANRDQWAERYLSRQAHDEGESSLDQVAYAAVVGQIETVLIGENARVEGRVDGESGRIEYGESGDARTDDVLDDIAEYTLRLEGDVRFLPDDRMPSDTGVAAILRYAMKPA